MAEITSAVDKTRTVIVKNPPNPLCTDEKKQEQSTQCPASLAPGFGGLRKGFLMADATKRSIDKITFMAETTVGNTEEGSIAETTLMQMHVPPTHTTLRTSVDNTSSSVECALGNAEQESIAP